MIDKDQDVPLWLGILAALVFYGVSWGGFYLVLFLLGRGHL